MRVLEGSCGKKHIFLHARLLSGNRDASCPA
jgi:hypothetical protein